MGSFVATCAISSLPIGYGEKVVLLPIMIRQKIGSTSPMCTRLFQAADLLRPIFLPVTGTYQDYGTFFDDEQDWGLITSEQGLERVKTHFVSGDGEGNLFAYREVPDVYEVPRRCYPDYDKWEMIRHGVDTLAIRSEVWDYFVKEHTTSRIRRDEVENTFEQKWEGMEAHLRRYFLPASAPKHFKSSDWDKHDMFFNFNTRELETPLRYDLELYCQCQGYDIESLSMPGMGFNGIPTNVREWMSYLMYHEDMYVRCLDEPVFLDKNLEGMRRLAEMVHVLFCLGRMRRALVPVSGTGSQGQNWADAAKYYTKMRDIALSKMVES